LPLAAGLLTAARERDEAQEFDRGERLKPKTLHIALRVALGLREHHPERAPNTERRGGSR
jgi:hypothetical protein